MKSRVRYITFTAALLALAVAFQSLRTLLPVVSILGIINTQQIIIGSLVNLVLFISTWMVGFWSGAAISVLVAFIGYLQGGMPPIPMMIAAVAFGNLALVFVSWALRKSTVVAVIAAAAVKFAALYAITSWIVIPYFVSAEPVKKVISAGFSWPQLITALIGGILALAVYPSLRRATKSGVQH